MLKTLSLSISSKKKLKNEKVLRTSTGFNAIKKVGIVINQDNIETKAVEQLLQNFQNKGIQVEVLCYSSKKHTLNLNFPVISFSKKDIKWTGKFRNFRLKKFICTDFDYLYTIINKSNLILDNVIIHSKAKCRVGKFEYKKSKLYELMVCQESNSLTELSNQMFYYTSKIK